MAETCALCEHAAIGQCVRCDVPVCDAHTPLVFQRCVTCEEHYQRQARRGFPLHALVGSVVALVSGVAIMAILAQLDLGRAFENETRRVYVHVFAMMFGALFSALAVTEWLRRRARRRFLAELHVTMPTARVV